jgi:hypothetical protein
MRTLTTVVLLLSASSLLAQEEAPPVTSNCGTGFVDLQPEGSGCGFDFSRWVTIGDPNSKVTVAGLPASVVYQVDYLVFDTQARSLMLVISITRTRPSSTTPGAPPTVTSETLYSGAGGVVLYPGDTVVVQIMGLASCDANLTCQPVAGKEKVRFLVQGAAQDLGTLRKVPTPVIVVEDLTSGGVVEATTHRLPDDPSSQVVKK